MLPAFYRTAPADELIGQPAPPLTFCLAERGQQYLVYSDVGVPFFLDTSDPVGKTGFWFYFSHENGVLLPRQTRDKRKENSQTEGAFPRGWWLRIMP